MTKEELLERLDNWHNQDSSLALIKKLIKATPDNDPDLKKALDDGVAEELVSLTIDCNTTESLLDWLATNDFDVFNNYRYAEVDYLSDYDDIEDMKENSRAFYNGELDCLVYNEETGAYVISW